MSIDHDFHRLYYEEKPFYQAKNGPIQKAKSLCYIPLEGKTIVILVARIHSTIFEWLIKSYIYHKVMKIIVMIYCL